MTRLSEIRARLAAHQDYALHVHAPADLRWLLERVEMLEARIEQLEAWSRNTLGGVPMEPAK